jgi:23S rRNA (uracil1939-C5)-methyltransferase
MQRRRPPSRRRTRKDVRELTIERLNIQGEGIAGELSVPFALPGEVVRAAVSGRRAYASERLHDAQERFASRCPHFGLPGDGCGGCTLQHLGEERATGIKAERLLRAVRGVFPEAELTAVHRSPPKSRRRAKFSVTPAAAGLHRLAGSQTVGLRDCDVLRHELMATLSPLRKLSAGLRSSFDAEATLSGTGLDLALSAPDWDGLDVFERLSAFAEEEDLARLSLNGVPVAERRPPLVTFGGVPVTLPAGSFLQATEEGEAALQGEVLAACKGAGTVADLFSGLGTFALPLSQGAEVRAADSAGSASAALTRAAKQAKLPLTSEARDLYRRPLLASELRFDAVVFDPPRAGAAEQAAEIAKAAPRTVVAVSCNPQSLARDLSHFAATFRLDRLAMVDQFGWSPHVEAVVVLQRRVI